MIESPGVWGAVTVRRRRGFGFPWGEVMAGDDVVAEVGRFSVLNLFLGRGQRIRLPDGSQWRVTSSPWHEYVCPVVLDEGGTALAISAPGYGSYAIDKAGRSLTLQADEGHHLGRARQWVLREEEMEIGRVRHSPHAAELDLEVPLASVLLAFVLAAFGVLGEGELATVRIAAWAWRGSGQLSAVRPSTPRPDRIPPIGP